MGCTCRCWEWGIVKQEVKAWEFSKQCVPVYWVYHFIMSPCSVYKWFLCVIFLEFKQSTQKPLWCGIPNILWICCLRVNSCFFSPIELEKLVFFKGTKKERENEEGRNRQTMAHFSIHLLVNSFSLVELCWISEQCPCISLWCPLEGRQGQQLWSPYSGHQGEQPWCLWDYK